MKTTAIRISARRPAHRSAPRPTAGKWRNAARIGFGGFFLAMAAINATVTLPNAAEIYQALADLSWPGFDWLALRIVQPAGVPFSVLLVAFEIGVAVLVLSKGRQVRLGLLAALGFMIVLAPFISLVRAWQRPAGGVGAGVVGPGLRPQPAEHVSRPGWVNGMSECCSRTSSPSRYRWNRFALRGRRSALRVLIDNKRYRCRLSPCPNSTHILVQ